jgi:Dehydrogenases with different specificities (related to short-chain alcohol dehydrogenases)
MNDLLLGGQTAIVTGAGSGLGRASAYALARIGARLVLLDRDATALDVISTELGSTVISCHVTDVTDMSAVSAAFADLPACDILVNSAGIEGPRGGLEKCDPADLRRVMEINLFGGLNCVQAAVPKMKAAGKGAIVNIASTAGLVGSARLGAYGVSKAAVVSMTRSLAISLAPSGIRVNAVCPGSIDSPMFDRTLDAASAEADRAHMISIHPLGRLGQPEEVAQAVVYLASPASSYCTGVLLPVDGGRLA